MQIASHIHNAVNTSLQRTIAKATSKYLRFSFLEKSYFKIFEVLFSRKPLVVHGIGGVWVSKKGQLMLYIVGKLIY